jgi:hypothetical protein
MMITRQKLLERMWELASTPPSQTNNTVDGQRQAWKLLLNLRGGKEFIASKPATEVEHLQRLLTCIGPAHYC